MAETITEYIRRDLRSRLQKKDGALLDLTLTALSERYQVSLTPIRLAVRDLVTERILVKQPNGRLTAADVARQAKTAGAEESVAEEPDSAPPLELERVEKEFTADVIRMSLRGETDFLREEATADGLGIGRAVLRQLLSRLQGKGLIEHVPRRGWRVRSFDVGDMTDYLEVRVCLELKALSLAKDRLVRGDLVAMLDGNRPGSGLDNNLHRYIVEKSGNVYIRDFFDRHGIYFTMLFDYAAPETSVTRTMARQHREILRALIARDWKKAGKTLAHHIRSQKPVLRRLLKLIAERKPANGGSKP